MPTIVKDGPDRADATQESIDRLWAGRGYKVIGSDGFAQAERSGFVNNRVAQLEGKLLLAYGHSWVASDFQNTANYRALLRFLDRLDAFHFYGNEAKAGIGVDATAFRALGDISADGHLIFQPSVVFWVDCFINQVGYCGFTDASAKASILNSLRALLATLCHQTRIEESAMTASGSWSTSAGTEFSGGSSMFTTQNGAYLEVVVNVPASGHIDVVVMGMSDNATTWPFPGADYQVNVDGVLAAAGTTKAQHRQYVGVVAECRGFCPMVIPLSGLAPGNHTIRIIRPATSDAGSYLWVDCILTRRRPLPNILLWTCPRLPWPSLWASYSVTPNFHQTTQAEVDALNTAVYAMLAAEFPSVIILDSTEGWDMTTMLGFDGLHANDKGSAYLANLAQWVASQAFVWNSTIGLNVTP